MALIEAKWEAAENCRQPNWRANWKRRRQLSSLLSTRLSSLNSSKLQMGRGWHWVSFFVFVIFSLSIGCKTYRFHSWPQKAFEVSWQGEVDEGGEANQTFDDCNWNGIEKWQCQQTHTETGREREGDRLTHTLSYVLLKAILLVLVFIFVAK